MSKSEKIFKTLKEEIIDGVEYMTVTKDFVIELCKRSDYLYALEYVCRFSRKETPEFAIKCLEEIKRGCDFDVAGLESAVLQSLVMRDILSERNISIGGHVYIIETPNGVKIGKSKTPIDRIRRVETASGMLCTKKLVSHKFNEYHEAERELQNEFSENRGIGEYFSASFCDISDKARSMFPDSF